MARKLSRQGERALHAANQIAERAWATKDRAERHALIAQALALSPLCADAHVLLAEMAERGSAEAIAHWRRAVSVGAAAVGPVGFRIMAAMDERPDHADAYLEALHGLADALWDSGARDEGIATMQRSLTVNPRDEDRMRDRLLGCLMEEGRDDEAMLLLLGTLNDGGGTWQWATALLGFRMRGADEETRVMLCDAVADNADVARRLLGRERAPGIPDAAADEGLAIEAMLITGALEGAWLGTPGALDWLEAELPGLLATIAEGQDAPPDANEDGEPR